MMVRESHWALSSVHTTSMAAVLTIRRAIAGFGDDGGIRRRVRAALRVAIN